LLRSDCPVKTNIQYPTGNAQCPSVEASFAAAFIKIKMAEYFTWILEIGYWALDIDFAARS
jgi:hypothetical protein